MQKGSERMDVYEYRDILLSAPINPETNIDILQRRWQSSVINSQDIITVTGTVTTTTTTTTSSPITTTTTTTTTTDIINDNNDLLQELFCEACSTLYNDILNAIDHQTVVNESDILRRRMEIIEQGTELSNTLPQLSNLITSKLSTINRAMEHLKLNRRSSVENAENAAKEDDEPTAVSELRKWLQMMGEKLSVMENKFTKATLARKELDRLAADQQILQLQIETEGHTLVNNIQRTVTRNLEVNERGIDHWIQRRQRHLKTLTKRWYHLWIRSLSVQCRIERQLDHLYPSDDESENDPELREPQVKRRRLHNSDKEYEERNELEKGSNEDIIPFAEEEYESIDCKTMLQTEKEYSWNTEEEKKLNESTCLTITATTTTTTTTTTTAINNNSCTITNHHSDIENSWNDKTNNFQGMNSHLTWLPPTNVDEQRRQRIQHSPVKSFYKTVPLDETGATDTEVPRVSMSSWPTGNLGSPTDMHVLTDSLIVNTEEEPEMDSNDDIKEILSMLNDDENGNPKWEGLEQRGTQWREFKCGKTRYQLSFKRNWLLGCVDNNDKHSCDASSEESDDLPTDLNPIIEVKSTTPSVLDVSSLKRRRKGRLSTLDRFPSMMKISNGTLGQDMESSICSQTWSEIPHLDGATASLGSIRLPPVHYLGNTLRSKHQVRRKLRARRLPRSMSDGEHIGMYMDASIHSAPGASMSHWNANLCLDSDSTGPDQSDAPPYEWDDYRPPAKREDEWDDGNDREDISVLTIEDDFHMQFGSFHSSFPAHLYSSSNRQSDITDEKKIPIREKASRPIATVAGKCMRKHSNTSVNDKLELVKARTIPLLSKLLNSSKSRHFSESDIHNVLIANNDNTNSNNTECIQSFPLSSPPQQSPLPIILSKIEKFASSLKLIHHNDSDLDLSFSTLSSIRSLGDVVSTLKIFNDIHEQLLEEQEELQSLLSSDSFSGDLSGLLGEFEPLCRGYQEAVERVEQLMAQIEAIRDKWNDWSETQRIIQMMMQTIESDLCDLRKGTDNSEQICSELELCQERMNRLETACNYLSCNLASLHNRSSTQPPPIDFTSELALYSNALIQLKTRFEKEMGHARSADKATLVHSRKRVHLKNDAKTMTQLKEDNCASAIYSNWSIKVLFIVAIIAAFTAWFATSSLVPWRTTLGPHLDYVDGPPPL